MVNKFRVKCVLIHALAQQNLYASQTNTLSQKGEELCVQKNFLFVKIPEFFSFKQFRPTSTHDLYLNSNPFVTQDIPDSSQEHHYHKRQRNWQTLLKFLCHTIFPPVPILKVLTPRIIPFCDSYIVAISLLSPLVSPLSLSPSPLSLPLSEPSLGI